MKVVFPCRGSIVLLKQDVETLQSFYNTKLITSKLNETYKQSNVMVQIGSFNYIPSKSSVVLYKANCLTIEKMRKILGLYNEKEEQQQQSKQESQTQKANLESDSNESPIKDSDIMNNPFFRTLRPL